MSTLSLKNKWNINPQLLWTVRFVYLGWIAQVLAVEFRNQYLHNPAVHIFFQSRGLFLF